MEDMYLINLELEVLIAEREVMTSENRDKEINGESPVYKAKDFKALITKMKALSGKYTNAMKQVVEQHQKSKERHEQMLKDMEAAKQKAKEKTNGKKETK